MIGWIRTEWEFRAAALPSPATGIVGHSYGGGVAAEFARWSPGTISALASLSGQTGEGLAPIATAQIPKLFAFGSDQAMDASLMDLNPLPTSQAWANLPRPKHVAVLKDIGHWDYLRAGRVSCEGLRGDCTRTPQLTAELLLMFFGRYLRPEGAPDLRQRLPPSLVPPKFADLGLTTDQQFYAGGYLSAFESLAGAAAGPCGVALTWEADGGIAGTTTVPQTA
jgi:pimeloyl-ACP methyl ester carboxylesterase